MSIVEDEGISDRIKLKLLDEASVRSIREAMIEMLPPQSSLRSRLSDIEDQANSVRDAQRSKRG